MLVRVTWLISALVLVVGCLPCRPQVTLWTAWLSLTSDLTATPGSIWFLNFTHRA